MSIRFRIALWYAITLVVLLVLFGFAIRTAVERQLRQDVDNALRQPANEVAAQLGNQNGVPGFERAVYVPILGTFKSPGEYVQLDKPNGIPQAGSTTLEGDQLLLPPNASKGSGQFSSDNVNGTSVRVYTLPLRVHGHIIGYVQVGKSLVDEQRALRTLTTILIVVSAAAIVISSFIAWLVAGSALHPLATMTRAARSIARSRQFGSRLPARKSNDELGTLGATFNDVLAGLDQAHSVQQRFLADASHELRTPLTSLQANLDFLAMAPDAHADRRDEALSGARQSLDRMRRLVDDLLFLARVEAGQAVEQNPVELDQVVVRAYREIKPLSDGVHTDLASIDEAVVQGDPHRLQQVVLILLDNALKYTPSGGSISLALRADDGWATISVHDTGIGIAEDERESVFGRFYRSRRAAARHTDGSGLGLSIAREIVESHGGRIRFESTAGEGTTFTVELPVTNRRA